jgi:hypothetical protein
MVSFLFFVFFFLYTKMTKWSEHVKKHAKKHKMSYREASMDSKCKESYRKMSKKRMSPRKMSKKRMSPRKMSKKRMSPRKMSKKRMSPKKKGNPRRMNAPEDDESQQEWIVVESNREEEINTVVEITNSQEEAEQKMDAINIPLREAYRKNGTLGSAYYYGPFSRGTYNVGDRYEL